MKRFSLPIILTASFIYLSFLAADNLVDQTKAAAELFGLNFTEAEVDSMQDQMEDNIEAYEKLRENSIANETAPAVVFRPDFFSPIPKGKDQVNPTMPIEVKMPQNKEELAFYPLTHLAWLIQNQKITPTELTKLYLERLKKYGDTLECVVTITEELALEQAKRATEEIKNGKYRGLLHGIPYGAKDLLSVEGYKTTWGATPYKDQVIDETATLIKKLEEEGAILVAKLTLGALAWGDVWYGGVTRNPWNLKQGSSGSSAGSASATVAGLVAFSIGTETLGSIVSPSTRCGASGLRPTFGGVSRHGAMALSWTMDKIGPICRRAEDCALVFAAIHGGDPRDPFSIDYPFNYGSDDMSSYRVGYTEDLFKKSWNRKNDSVSLLVFEKGPFAWQQEKWMDAGFEVGPLSLILSVEAAAAFDELTRTGKDDEMVRQIKNAWPNVFRAARMVPAVEYIQANRLRSRLVQKVNAYLEDYDALVVPSFGDNQLLVTNLTGHPCVVIPNGYRNGSPTSICIIGKHYQEGKLLALARYYQDQTDFADQRPPYFIP